MSFIKDLTISKARRGLKEKKFSAHELVKQLLEEIKNSKQLNSFITVNAENAIKNAVDSDKKIQSGNARDL